MLYADGQHHRIILRGIQVIMFLKRCAFWGSLLVILSTLGLKAHGQSVSQLVNSIVATSCSNQFVRSIAATGSGTCATVALADMETIATQTTLGNFSGSTAVPSAVAWQTSTAGNSGYTKLPNGVIIQGGLTGAPSSGQTTTNLPITCPNNIISASATINSGGGTGNQIINAFVSAVSTSQIVIQHRFLDMSALPPVAGGNASQAAHYMVLCY